MVFCQILFICSKYRIDSGYLSKWNKNNSIWKCSNFGINHIQITIRFIETATELLSSNNKKNAEMDGEIAPKTKCCSWNQFELCSSLTLLCHNIIEKYRALSLEFICIKFYQHSNSNTCFRKEKKKTMKMPERKYIAIQSDFSLKYSEMQALHKKRQWTESFRSAYHRFKSIFGTEHHRLNINVQCSKYRDRHIESNI